MPVPKLSRGGRSFLREVAVVVLGVFIALVLEQMASSWRDRQRMQAIQAAMNEELADHAEVFAIRMRARPCIVAKLDALDALLARPGARGPWRNVDRPPFYFSSSGAWNSGVSDLLSRHIGPARLRIYGEAYQGMGQYMAIADEEQAHWIVLQTLERLDEPIGGERRCRLVKSAAGARHANLLLSAIAEQMLANIERLGIRRTHAMAGVDVRGRPLCQRLTTGRG